MKKKLRGNRAAIIVLFIFLCLLIFVKCVNEENDNIRQKEVDSIVVANQLSAKKTSYQEFAGSESCRNCHGAISKTHIHTSHHLTTQPAVEKNIKGKFQNGKNKYYYNPALMVAMEKRDSALYQVVYHNGEEKLALPFNLVIGSGAKGQSFAYWKNQSLFQMPVTFFSAAQQWANSPGFPNKVLSNRPITSRCLECHSTFIEKLSTSEQAPEQFDRKRLIYGVNCEKCHGPAARHVAFQTENPKEKEGKFIVNPARLSRQQNLDLCALCHGGRLEKKQASFSFVAGDTLSNFYTIDTVSALAASTGNFDVHGNQYGLLRASKCFRMSPTMTCGTCHSPHENERGKTILFSRRCMECHNKAHQSFCKIDKRLVPDIENNCIDCHMPAQPSRAIALYVQGRDVPVASLIRSHLITVYRDATEKFINQKKKK